jgi:hypothetical protein
VGDVRLETGEQLIEELEYAVPDVVAQAAGLPAGHEGRVGHIPALVALAFDDRACVAAAHRDDDVGQADLCVPADQIPTSPPETASSSAAASWLRPALCEHTNTPQRIKIDGYQFNRYS